VSRKHGLSCPSPAQIAKLLIIPFVCLVEHFWLGKTFSRAVIASVVTVVIGVAIVCVP
jgi:solute carrier family 35 protein E3